MTVNYPKHRGDEVTLAKDIFDEIVADTEREDFNCLDKPDYIKTETPGADETRSDASLPDNSDRRLKSSKIL